LLLCHGREVLQTDWRHGSYTAAAAALIDSYTIPTSQLGTVTHTIVQPGELCSTKPSSSSKTRESKLWNTKEQSRRELNLTATSASGLVTVVPASAAPELDSMLIIPTRRCLAIRRSDGTVHKLLFRDFT